MLASGKELPSNFALRTSCICFSKSVAENFWVNIGRFLGWNGAQMG
jgi:hypothetical protein